MKSWLFLSIFSLLLLSPINHIRYVEGQVGTLVEKDILEDTEWVPEKSPYVIIRSVTISAILEIKPGVIVRVADDVTLRVSSVGGRLAMLSANGTKDMPVTFMGQGDRKNWELVVTFGRLHIRNLVVPESIRVGVSPGSLVMQDSNIEGDLTFSSISGDVDIRHVTVKSITISDPQFWSVFIGSSVRLTSVRSESITIDSIGPKTTTELASISTRSLRLGIIAGNLGRAEYSPARVLVQDSTIAFGSGVTVRETQGIVNITRNNIYSNSPYALEIGAGRVFAENNWWGDPNGPNHVSVNPEGRGDRIQARPDDIDFIPWLRTQISDAPLPIEVEKEPPKPVEEAPQQQEQVKEVIKEVPKEVIKEVIRTETIEVISPITYLAVTIAIATTVIATILWSKVKKAEDRMLAELRSRK